MDYKLWFPQKILKKIMFIMELFKPKAKIENSIMNPHIHISECGQLSTHDQPDFISSPSIPSALPFRLFGSKSQIYFQYFNYISKKQDF